MRLWAPILEPEPRSSHQFADVPLPSHLLAVRAAASAAVTGLHTCIPGPPHPSDGIAAAPVLPPCCQLPAVAASQCLMWYLVSRAACAPAVAVHMCPGSLPCQSCAGCGIHTPRAVSHTWCSCGLPGCRALRALQGACKSVLLTTGRNHGVALGPVPRQPPHAVANNTPQAALEWQQLPSLPSLICSNQGWLRRARGCALLWLSPETEWATCGMSMQAGPAGSRHGGRAGHARSRQPFVDEPRARVGSSESQRPLGVERCWVTLRAGSMPRTTPADAVPPTGFGRHAHSHNACLLRSTVSCAR
jgi:hypothetical protein